MFSFNLYPVWEPQLQWLPPQPSEVSLNPICITQHVDAASLSQCSELAGKCNFFVLLKCSIVSKKFVRIVFVALAPVSVL